ncbi:MAG: 23S rRNA (adenine(2503)-C(2))-methyltransferase RlmN [Clostridia bacterium]|nr:23S rRNA (adenine(2503)-C(2))-methyltransferase RlmN [Clostridia bacterium]
MILLQDFTLEELTEYLTANYNVKPFVAKQVYGWLTKSVDFDGMTNISKDLRESLKRKCVAVSCKIIKTLSSADGTQKFLFELFDGNVIEGVLMKYKYGNTLCVSSQVGCRNVSERNISLSTCGIAPKMRELADLGFSVNLTISLHNADSEQRKQIMPITNAFSVEEVISACRYYFEKTGRRIIAEYTLIDGQNDSYSHALKLASHLRGISAHVNIIALNPVKETGLKGTGENNLKKFIKYLDKLGISATRRRTMGQDIEGACGQLRRRYLEGSYEK